MSYSRIYKKYVEFLTNNYWDMFDYLDLFSLRSNKNHDAIFSFANSDDKMIKIFHGKDGLNYLFDIFTNASKDDLFSLEEDEIRVYMKTKDELNAEELIYLMQIGKNVKSKNNLIVMYKKYDHLEEYCKGKDLDLIADYFEFVSSILKNKKMRDDIIDVFKEHKMIIADFNIEEKRFMIYYDEFGMQWYPIRKTAKHKSMIEQYKDLDFIDDEGFIIKLPLPLNIHCDEFTSILLFYYPNSKRIYFDYVLGSTKNPKNLFVALDNSLSTIGLAKDYITNDRYIESAISTTLKNLNSNIKRQFKVSSLLTNFNLEAMFSILNKLLESEDFNTFKTKNDCLLILQHFTNVLNENKNSFLNNSQNYKTDYDDEDENYDDIDDEIELDSNDIS